MRFASLVCLLLTAAPVDAQWATDPEFAPELSAGAQSDVRPQVVTTPDGYIYVAWLQEMAPITPVPNRGLFLQRLDPQGRPQWAAGGVMIDAGIGASLDPPKMKLSPSGDLWLAYIDRETTPIYLRLTRVNRDGFEVWGSGGAVVASTNARMAQAELAVFDNGTAIVAWNNVWWAAIRRVASDGQVLGPAITFPPQTIGASRPMVIGLERVAPDEVMAIWAEPDTSSPQRDLRAQKYLSDGSELFVSGGIVVGTHVFYGQGFGLPLTSHLVPDGSGGGWFVYPNGVGNVFPPHKRAALQHVESDGSLPLGPDGSRAESSIIGRDVVLVVDPESGEPTFFFAWGHENSDTLVRGQRFDLAGVPQWGATVSPFIYSPPASSISSFDAVGVPGGTRMLVTEGTWNDPSAPSTCRSWFVGNDGVVDPARTIVLASGIGAGFTGGVATTVGPFGDVINVWSEGPTAAPDLKRVRAQNITATDELGPAAGALSRNAGANLDVYTATVEPLGGVATLDLALPAAAGTGLVVGYLGTASFPVSGFEVLVDINGLELLQLAPKPGPNVQYVIPIPAAPALSGTIVRTQGFQLGAGVPFRLTNAQDLYLGL